MCALVVLWGCGGVGGAVPEARPSRGPAAWDEAALEGGRVEVGWRRKVGGGLVAAPAVAGSAVVFATVSGEVHALDATSGSRRWRRRIGEGEIGGITADGDRVYVAEAMRHGAVVALSAVDGRKVWGRRVGVVRHAPTVVAGRVVVATGGGTVVAFDAATGRVVWETEVAGAASSPPLPYRGSVVVATTADTLYRLDLANGAVVGRTVLPGRVSAPSVLVGDVVLLPMGSGDVAGHDLEHDALRWIAALDGPIHAAPVVGGDGAAYVLTRPGTVWRVDAVTGAAARVAAAGGAATRSFARAGSAFVVGTLDGTLLLVESDGMVAWRERLGDSIVAPAVAYGDAVYVPLLRGGVVKLERREEPGEEARRW